MNKQEMPVKSVRLLFVPLHYPIHYRFATKIILHLRCGIITITSCSWCEIDYLKSQLTCPRSDFRIIMLIRWNKIRSLFFRDAEALHQRIAFQHILIKFFVRHQHRIWLVPRRIEQMPITMTTHIMAFLQKALDDIRELLIKFSGKEETAFNITLL